MGRLRRQLRDAHRRVTRAHASGTYHRCHRCHLHRGLFRPPPDGSASDGLLPRPSEALSPGWSVAVLTRKDLVGDPSKRFGEIPRPPPCAGGVDAQRVAVVSGQRERQEIPRYDHGVPQGIPPSLYERVPTDPPLIWTGRRTPPERPESRECRCGAEWRRSGRRHSSNPPRPDIAGAGGLAGVQPPLDEADHGRQ